MIVAKGKVLGHRIIGDGLSKAIVLHDWIGDSTNWDPVLPLLDEARFCWALTDLRGYGRSQAISGQFTLSEAVADVVATADALGWDRFAVIGHSMSSLIAMTIGQSLHERIDRIVIVAPCPPEGIGVDAAGAQYLQSLCGDDVQHKIDGLAGLWGDRLSERWVSFKARRWQAAAVPSAAAGYVDMFARQGLMDGQRRIAAPVLAITGEQDAPFMQCHAIMQSYNLLCAELSVSPIATAGHYPMQESPPLTYSLIERFLANMTPHAE